MHSTSIPLLLVAAGTVGFLHSILPDHWVPLAVIARTQRWSLARTARTSLLASIGHVVTSIILGGIIALVGLQFRSTFEAQQGHIVGVILVLTGIGFVVWWLVARDGHGHHHHDHQHHHNAGLHEPLEHIEEESLELLKTGAATEKPADQSPARRLAAIAVPFGAAASPDLTILPIFLAASAVGIGTIIGVLTTFSAVTLATFVALTVAATIAGYQVKGDWLEDHGNLITAVVLLAIGIAVYLGL